MVKSIASKFLIAGILSLAIVSCNSNESKPQKVSTIDSIVEHSDSLIKKDTSVKSEAAIPAKSPEDSVVKHKSQIEESLPTTFDSTKRYVYLTFDDGPQPGTENVYHTLKALGVNGTFFMVGLHATYSKLMRSYVDTIRNSYPEILLANHSYTHARDRYEYFYHHVQSCFEDFMKAQNSLQVQKKFIRLPGNSAWILKNSMLAHPLVKPVCKLLDSAGFNVIGWDVEWSFKRDPKGGGSVPVQSAETMVNMVEYALNHHHTHRRNAVVLLSHDRMFRHANYADSLYKFIKTLKEKNPNYVFETVEHYPTVK